MTSTSLERLPHRFPFFYGWVIVGVATLAFFFSGPGQTYSISVFVDPLIADFGWSRSLISGIYSVATLVAGLAMVSVGRVVDRKGHRTTLTAIAVLFAAACLFMSAVIHPAMLFIGFICIRVLGQGSLMLIPFSLVPQWFVRMRGRALAVVAIGGSISSAALPYINILIIEASGWRSAWHVWAALLALILAPVAWVFTRTRPEELGLQPDGAPAPHSDGTSSGGEPAAERSWTVHEVIRSPVFWVVIVLTSIPAMVNTGATFHHMSILTAGGLSLEAAAGVFSVAAVASLVTNPVAGYLSDRLRPERLLAGMLLWLAITTVWLLWAGTTQGAVALGVFRGVNQAFFTIVNGVVWPAFFGRRHLAGIRGVTTTAMVVASALGPLPFGMGFDWFGGYTEVILVMAGICIVGAAVGLGLRRPQAVDGDVPA